MNRDFAEMLAALSEAGAEFMVIGAQAVAEIADALVAAAATTSGIRVWTLNRKHYPMPDIRFYDK